MDRVHSLIDSIRRAEPFRGIVERRRQAEGRDSVLQRSGLGASIPRPIRMDVGFRIA
jgi:hypothetical protein